MKTYKILILTLILFVGINFQNCSGDEFGCDDCPVIDGAYFDIKGVNLAHSSTNDGKYIGVGDSIFYSNYSSLFLELNVDYISQCIPNTKSYDLNFSTMSSAYGCSCVGNGGNGSKNEGYKSFDVITLHDYNSNYKANDTINDILDFYFENDKDVPFSMDKYVSSQAETIVEEFIFIKPIESPESNQYLELLFKIELTTGEVYEETSPKIFLK